MLVLIKFVNTLKEPASPVFTVPPLPPLPAAPPFPVVLSSLSSPATLPPLPPFPAAPPSVMFQPESAPAPTMFSKPAPLRFVTTTSSDASSSSASFSSSSQAQRSTSVVLWLTTLRMSTSVTAIPVVTDPPLPPFAVFEPELAPATTTFETSALFKFVTITSPSAIARPAMPNVAIGRVANIAINFFVIVLLFFTLIIFGAFIIPPPHMGLRSNCKNASPTILPATFQLQADTFPVLYALVQRI